MSVLESATTSVHSLEGPGDSQARDDELPRVVLVDVVSTDPIDELLLAVARGDREAFVALESRVGGLVRANIRRILRDASRADAATREFFAEVLRDANDFDPGRDSAHVWLLTRAHQRAVGGLGPGEAGPW